ncbi:hypothetical protein CDD83_2374 [Cordyceps sp. RAO-2017]|nr:hypothetical protein CDD83_2374 [Cordyceps sp. RAO-2017]
MAFRLTASPWRHCCTRARPAPHAIARRAFFNLPGSTGGGGGSGGEAQHLAATRTLPYAHGALYELIADVESYERFVPYCSRSRVTEWSPPDARGRRWPALADLHVGWGGFSDVFTSRLRCVPGVSVEAVSGGESAAPSAVFKTLITRWSVRPGASDQPSSPSTEVRLTIDYRFANPVYAAVSAAVSDKVAGLMVEAFEKRARDILGPSSSRS